MAPPVWAWVTYDLRPGRERLQPWRMAAAWAEEAARRGARPVVVDLHAAGSSTLRTLRPSILWVQVSPRSRWLDLGPRWGARVAVVPGPIETLRRARGRRAKADALLAPIFARRLGAFDRVLVFTERQARALVAAGCRVPIDVWPPSVTPIRAARPGPVARRFLYLGPDRPERGLEVLRRAFVLAEWSVPGISLTTLIRRDPPAGTFDLAAALRGADAVVVPTLWAESDAPVVPLEARAAGRPLIVTDVDGLPELAGPGAIVVPPGNARALADAMIRMASDPALFARLAAESRPAPAVPLPVPPLRPPRPLILSGPDGAGKSTLIAALPWGARITWLRMPHYACRALHAAGALFGGTRKVGGSPAEPGGSAPRTPWRRLARNPHRDGGIASLAGPIPEEYRYHDFRHIPWLRAIYPWVQLVDLAVAHTLRRADLYDRHWPDVLVDLVLKTGRRDLLSRWGAWARRLFGRLPAVVLMAPRDVLLARRPILALDPQLDERLALYAEVARRFDLPVLDGTAPVRDLVEALHPGPAPATTSRNR